MLIKSLTLAAVMAMTPAAASVFGFTDSAHAQGQTAGGGASTSSGGNNLGGGGSTGALETPKGIAAFANVPTSQRQPPTGQPRSRGSQPTPNHCALQVLPDGRMDCRNL